MQRDEEKAGGGVGGSVKYSGGKRGTTAEKEGDGVTTVLSVSCCSTSTMCHQEECAEIWDVFQNVSVSVSVSLNPGSTWIM